MDIETISQLHALFQEMHKKQDLKSALDVLFFSMRNSFVFDNVAVYLEDPQDKSLDVVYARAMGRGRTAEADASWGEAIAHEVITSGELIMREPSTQSSQNIDRMSQTYLLGIPLQINSKFAGALLFVRFGGPAYSDIHIHIASLQAFWLTFFN
ncbi:MAG: two-component sensor histidine kinase [Chloroflexi bacterium OLB14]|nr:MAG: two-component sensor histidine kinase [Chloroflexi bacterium OLB14]